MVIKDQLHSERVGSQKDMSDDSIIDNVLGLIMAVANWYPLVLNKGMK